MMKMVLVVGMVCGTQQIYAGISEDFVNGNKVICELTTPEYVGIIRPFLPENPIILEAGAHGGQDTVILAKSWPQGVVYAFEPVPKFVDFIHGELKNHGVKNARLFPFALAEKSGDQTFYYSNAIGAASSLLPDNGICDYQDTKMTVPCMNLDEWARIYSVDHIDFMWLDMEGVEFYVLNAAPVIMNTVKVIISEVNFREFRRGTTQYKELYALLTGRGFSLHKIWGHSTHQGTALFIRSELIQ